MAFLYLIEEVIAALFILLMLTQVVMPVYTGRPTFPIFRWRGKQSDLAEAQEDLELAALDKEILDLQLKLDLQTKLNSKQPVDGEKNDTE